MDLTIVIIVVVLVLGLFFGASFALGRMSWEVENARDSEYLEVDGTWVRYRVMGGGPPVVLVHGFLASSRIWEQVAGRLAQRFTVYTLDLGGFGESDKPLSGYGVRYGSRILYGFFTHFGLTKAAIIGHDLGGDMAVKLAADHPDMVEKIVLVAAPANEEQIDLPTPLWLATLPVVGPIFYMLGRYLRPIRQLWVRSFVMDPADIPEELVEDSGEPNPAAVSKTLSVGLREISRGRLVRQAGALKSPVLVIAGEEDQIVDPRSTEDWSRGTGAEVALMEDCGHLPMIENAAEFNAHVLAFLTGDSRYLEDVSSGASGRLEDVAPADEDEEDHGEETPKPPERDEEGESGEEMEEEAEREGEEGVTEREEEEWERPRAEHGGEEEEAEERPRRRRRGGRRESSGKDYVPELPEDLFEWPSAWEEYRSDRHQEEEEEGKSDEEERRD
jgi:pimeloyl-ACP methyl ester carboxylesterase